MSFSILPKASDLALDGKVTTDPLADLDLPPISDTRTATPAKLPTLEEGRKKLFDLRLKMVGDISSPISVDTITDIIQMNLFQNEYRVLNKEEVVEEGKRQKETVTDLKKRKRKEWEDQQKEHDEVSGFINFLCLFRRLEFVVNRIMVIV